PVGILDWYTILVGVFALAALTAHGAAFLAWKTDGPVQARSRAVARAVFPAVALLWPVLTWATRRVHPGFLEGLLGRPPAWLAAAAALAGLVTVFAALPRGRDRAAFLGSAAFLGGLSVATAASVYPVMLRASGDAALSLTAQNAAGDASGLRTAFGWLLLAVPLLVLYLAIVWRMHRGKVPAGGGGAY